MTCLEKMRKQVERYYFRRELKYLDLDNPRTYNEKIQWSKIYDSTPIKTELADKYLVREWVKKKKGEQYLIPLLGVYDCFDQIYFGEMTFTSASGFFHHWNDDSFDRYFGDKFQLPEKGYDIETGKYFDIPRGNPVARTIKKIIFNTFGMILKPVRIMKRAIFGKKKQKITSI